MTERAGVLYIGATGALYIGTTDDLRNRRAEDRARSLTASG
jgi:predicted GIY-YIG superfamily endonuclease